MSPAMLKSGEFAVSHWTVVIAIAALFLVIQIVLSLRLYWRARRHQRVLSDLCDDLEQGGDGRGGGRWLPGGFTWLRWVMAIFPPGHTSRRGAFTREDVLEELDTRLASNADYLLLQRMGVMAPLLGVVLTVVGFFFLNVNEAGSESLGSILMAVAPLVSGVGAGAVLALINQVLLHAVGVRFESLRTTARAWFDSAVWSRLADEQSPALAKAAGALERFAEAVGGSAERHIASSKRMDESTAAIGHAALQFRDVVKAFGSEIRGVPQTLVELRNATAAAANALAELAPVGARAVANLDVSVAAFRSTIDREFTEAARLHHRSGKDLAEALHQISDSTESLRATTSGLQPAIERQFTELSRRIAASSEALNAMLAECTRSAEQATAAQAAIAQAGRELADSSGQLWQTMESEMGPAQRTMRESASSFAESAGELSAFIKRGLGPAARDLSSLHETLTGLRETVKSIQDFSQARADIDQLTDTLGRAADIADALSALPERVREIVEQNANHGLRLASSRTLKNLLPGRPR